ncbi:MAG: DEAD/DEAH box helicase family protein, partial [Pseudomonadota bacterium]|nr:DEAD/DEAH box helicase family protein [Pseudomonadota bacterium]
FDYLSGLKDLVLLMDESHRYRASAGVRAINELKPILGLELTATPFVETNRGPVPFKNVIYDYPLGQAMVDGFVKEPAVVTRRDFSTAGMKQEEIERLKLEDGVRLHESVKVELETYARETGNPIVKPFVLVIARDTTHAGQLMQLIQSEGFFAGRYADKVIQVDSSMTGAKEDEMIERLLKVEHTEEPTEIVIHVNMLKEGWDVTNLYTIVPLRAANARTLIEQSIGRGLRLPYGRRTGVNAVDRLNIVAHDKFQEIVDEANRTDSVIRLQQVILDPEQIREKTVTVVSQSWLASRLGLRPGQVTENTRVAAGKEAPLFQKPEEQRVAQFAFDAIRKLESQPDKAPGVMCLRESDVQQFIIREVQEAWRPEQMQFEGVDLKSVVAKTTDLVVERTIDIPRILVAPKGEVRSGFHSFDLDLSSIKYPPVSEDLWIKHLRTGQQETIGVGSGGIEEQRLEDYVVSGLIDFDDISYDDHAALLYDLAGQVVRHLQDYLTEEDARRVLRVHQRQVAKSVHVQMQAHYWEDDVEREVVVRRGFTELKSCAFTAAADKDPLDYRVSPADKSNMARYLFGGFQKCLYPWQKFQSDPERKMAVILEREAIKWFRPVRGQFQIFYKQGIEHHEYQPDFVAETADCIYMLEPKAANQMEDEIVRAKWDSAVEWCRYASDHAHRYKGKPWKYLLIPHDAIAENMTLKGLEQRFVVESG